MTPREWWNRLRTWRHRDRLGAQVNDELRAHVELIARDLEHEGWSRDDAYAAARRRLGNLGQLSEDSQQAWGFPAIDRLVQDVRYACRGLRRSPGFTATVVTSFALGIGANAAMFGVVDRLMFRPLPWLRDPASVHRVYLQSTNRQQRTFTNVTIPYTRYADLARASKVFDQVAAVSEWRLAVGSGEASQVRKVAGVSASFFGLFDAPPALGRYFTGAEDTTPLGAPVVVLSHRLWQSEFGARDVTGQPLQVGTITYTIIGVAPPGFVGSVQGSPPAVFVPITTIPANLASEDPVGYFRDYRWDWVEVLVRRRAGITEAMASADLTQAWIASRALQRALNPALVPDSIARPHALAGPVRSAAGPGAGLESRTLLWVTGVAGIVLLIACANIANLMLARMLRRRREIAVRLALGVRRRRLAAQCLTESGLLALIGCALGLGLAQWGGVAVRELLLPEGSPFDLFTDGRTLAVAMACAVAAALLTAIGPAILATRGDLADTLKAGAREGTTRRSRMRSALLVIQGALSVALLVGAGLFVRSLNRVSDLALGFDASPVLEVIPDLRGARMDSASTAAFRRRLLATAQSLPGVVAAARVNSGLFSTSTTDLRVPGYDSLTHLGRFNVQLTTADYFTVMQTRILRGRAIAESDNEQSPRVAVVSAAMANAVWPGRDAIGECMYVRFVPEAPKNPSCTTVVGVSEDAANQNLSDEQRLMYYLPLEQYAPHEIRMMYLRMSGDPVAQMEGVRRALNRAMPGDGFVIVAPLRERVDDQQRSWRLGATMFGVFGALALVVAAVGLYGVISYNVAQRMHELGVRIALGARAKDIVRLVVSQGLAFGSVGLAIGLLIAFLAAPWIEPLLFRLSARDPATYVTVGGLMLLVSLVASGVPALRATRADPNAGLRAD